MNLTILICTHNRPHLLARTLDYLNRANYPPQDCQILVVANACRDDTLSLLKTYQSKMRIPLKFLEESQPGKSHALNTGLASIDSGIVAFVDDDHRVAPRYPMAIVDAFMKFPDTALVCGRILPDWTGDEPAWIHNNSFYPLYPLPVPHYDQGPEERWICTKGPLPGGGNLALRKEVFDTIGGFSSELGPKGHDLGGSEDSEFVLRALKADFKLRYVPDMVQHHYVDLERLKLGYIIKKAYKRSQTVVRYRKTHRVPPPYLFRKVVEHFWRALISLYWPEKRFYLVRTAAALGELSAYLP
ncbi:MAG: glycosyltransferase [Methylohalobius sp. ZOD2]